MLSFGFLTLNKKVEMPYFTEIAKRATELSIEVYHFSPADIDPITEQVYGIKYHPDNNSWENAAFPIPTYLYDRCFYSSNEVLKKYSPIVNWLKNRTDLVFIGHGLPNKWKIYKVLATHPFLKYYIPKTQHVESPERVFSFLNKYKRILLKPDNGSQGRGIISLINKNNQIELRTHRHKTMIHKIFSKKEQLTSWLHQLLTTHSYLVQPYLSLQDQDNIPYDIRILLQKDTTGSWRELGRGIRKGQKDDIISNLHGGGEVYSFNEWLQSIDRNQRVLLLDDIRTITTHLPQVLEQSFGPLFELGIDIGVASDGTIWVLDTNSKPGHKTILKTIPGIENIIYSAPLLYCKHLEFQRS